VTTNLTPGAVAATTIVAGARDEIQAHGAETFPHECCGALISVDGVIVEAYRLPNTTDAGAARRFRVGPSDYRAAEARATERKGTLAGFYHSHPNEPARPSQYDLDHAWPNLIYVIISVNAGIPGDITAWHLRDDRTAFDQGDLRWHTGS
jgi:proteasome lid subunit RPN8/RPN11